MAHRHDKNRYALAVGHIAIEWNYLERDLQRLALHYLKLDAETVAHLFGFMGNVSRAEFTGYLAGRFEDDLAVREHVGHFISLFHRLRANRNIVEHGVPALTRDGAFLGEIIKIDRRAGELPFAASQETLDEFLQHLCATRAYMAEILGQLEDTDRSDIHELKKPPMPARLPALEQHVDAE